MLDRALLEVGAGERLSGMQCWWLAGVSIRVVPIVEAIRHIAVLLHFEHDDVGERMDGSRWDENSPGSGAKDASWSGSSTTAIACRRVVAVAPGFRPA